MRRTIKVDASAWHHLLERADALEAEVLALKRGRVAGPDTALECYNHNYHKLREMRCPEGCEKK